MADPPQHLQDEMNRLKQQVKQWQGIADKANEELRRANSQLGLSYVGRSNNGGKGRGKGGKDKRPRELVDDRQEPRQERSYRRR